jgi:LysM repeat protein
MNFITILLHLASLGTSLPTLGRPVPYSVRSGDTGYHIAAIMSMPFSILSKANQGINWNNLQIGQVLRVPTSWTPGDASSSSSNGRDSGSGSHSSPLQVIPINKA